MNTVILGPSMMRNFLRHFRPEATAESARLRLRAIVAADRAAVPCGRWVVLRRAHPGFQWDRPYLPPAMNRKLKKTVMRWRVRR